MEPLLAVIIMFLAYCPRACSQPAYLAGFDCHMSHLSSLSTYVLIEAALVSESSSNSRY